ncbi:DUF2637 domain-containing protein [Nonomuraea turcica]|uniref:DUF2637 domain-containing protein n=1 Tax=Nonomuraea sp. G32 TaxID=3067274 RepID=UPI00273CBE81|nr:DUF2637 domain-containing protein [Nonomuraea sp. G32]MDP4512139.1 DUF2637 domain-containing protein [Nonomuraea sp. G32]
MSHPSTPTMAGEAESADPALEKRMQRLFTLPFRARSTRTVPVAEASSGTGTGRLGDRVILGFAVAVLLAVAAAAAYVSYHHFYALAIALGERQDMAILYPAMSDGVIVMASLVMVYCSRRRIRVPVLAWVALALGGAVTLAANVAHGWSGGLGSRLVSALAPVAFAGAYELLMWIVRNTRRPSVEPRQEEHVCQPVETAVEVERVVPVLPTDRYEAARLAYIDSLGEGKQRLGRRPLMHRWGLEQREAEEIIADVEKERAQATETKGAEATGTEAGVPPPDRTRTSGTSEVDATWRTS